MRSSCCLCVDAFVYVSPSNNYPVSQSIVVEAVLVVYTINRFHQYCNINIVAFQMLQLYLNIARINEEAVMKLRRESCHLRLSQQHSSYFSPMRNINSGVSKFCCSFTALLIPICLLSNGYRGLFHRG